MFEGVLYMKEILKRQIKQLPPLPESIAQIESVYHNPESTFRDMTKILERDPMLTASLLKAANSPLYGFSREINNVGQAVSLFGMGTVRGFALATIVKESFTLDLSPYGITPDIFAQLSEMQNALVAAWYKKTKPALVNSLSPAAFLVELGKVLISRCVEEEKCAKEFSEKLKAEGVDKAEEEYCGTKTAAVSATIFDHWKFEPELITIIENSDDPSKAPDEAKLLSASLKAVRLAININATITPESIEAALAIVDEFELDRPSFEAALSTLAPAEE